MTNHRPCYILSFLVLTRAYTTQPASHVNFFFRKKRRKERKSNLFFSLSTPLSSNTKKKDEGKILFMCRKCLQNDQIQHSMLSFHCQLGPQFSSLLLAYFNLCRVRVHISSLNFFFSCEIQYSPREIIHSQMTFIDRNQRTHKNKTVKTPPDENWRAENAAKSPNIWSGVKLDFFPLTAAVKVQEIRANFISILSFHPESLPPRTPTFSSSPRTLPFNQWKSHFISLFSRLFLCARRLFFPCRRFPICCSSWKRENSNVPRHQQASRKKKS